MTGSECSSQPPGCPDSPAATRECCPGGLVTPHPQLTVWGVSGMGFSALGQSPTLCGAQTRERNPASACAAHVLVAFAAPPTVVFPCDHQATPLLEGVPAPITPTCVPHTHTGTLSARSLWSPSPRLPAPSARQTVPSICSVLKDHTN